MLNYSRRLLMLVMLSLLLASSYGLWLARAPLLDSLQALGLTSSSILGLSPQLATDLILINLADTRSAYDAYPRVLTVVESIIKEYEGVPVYILFNGNLFGQGNVLASRSQGAIDWAFLRALQARAPVIFNLGARDFDVMDPEAFVREAESYGITVISNLVSGASGRSLAPPIAILAAGEARFIVAGLAQSNLNAYREEVRSTLLPPDPVLWLEGGGVLLAGLPFVLLSQADLWRDRGMLRAVPESTLIVGGRQGLVFRGGQGLYGPIYLHNGSYGERVNVTRVSFAGGRVRMGFTDYPVDAATPANHDFQAFVEEVKEAQLRPEDVAVIGTLERDYTAAEAAQWAVETLREVSGADVAVLARDFFGDGLRAGPLPNHRFDTFLRFDSAVMSATVDAATLKSILARASLSAATSLEGLRGNFVYASDINPQEGELYTLVTSEHVTRYAEGLLGTAEIAFEPVPDTTVKGLLRSALERSR